MSTNTNTALTKTTGKSPLMLVQRDDWTILQLELQRGMLKYAWTSSVTQPRSSCSSQIPDPSSTCEPRHGKKGKGNDWIWFNHTPTAHTICTHHRRSPEIGSQPTKPANHATESVFSSTHLFRSWLVWRNFLTVLLLVDALFSAMDPGDVWSFGFVAVSDVGVALLLRLSCLGPEALSTHQPITSPPALPTPNCVWCGAGESE